MLPDEMARLDQFLAESFGEGIYARELRLTHEEVRYLQRKYPKACIRQFDFSASSDGKYWWEIIFLRDEVNDRIKEIAVGRE